MLKNIESIAIDFVYLSIPNRDLKKEKKFFYKKKKITCTS